MHRRARPLLWLAAPAALALVLSGGMWLSGCGGGDGGGNGGDRTGRLRIVATDAPIEPGLVELAEITVTRIDVHTGGTDDGGGFTTLPMADPVTIDLVKLVNGETQTLVAVTLPTGTYRQVRLYFSDATLTLNDEGQQRTYSTQQGDLQLTSQASSGLKVFIEPPVQVTVGGTAATVLLDFDLTKTFRPIPASKPPLEANRYQLGPVVRATTLAGAGTIYGTVTQLAGECDVEGATVHIMPNDEPDPANAFATTFTDATGQYAVIGLPPATWDVIATDGVDAVRVEDVVLPAGGSVEVNIDLTPLGGLEGTLTDSGDSEVVGATVTATLTFVDGEPPCSPFAQDTETVALGAYEFLGLPAGTYDVEFAADPYPAETVTGVEVLEGDPATVLNHKLASP